MTLGLARSVSIFVFILLMGLGATLAGAASDGLSASGVVYGDEAGAIGDPSSELRARQNLETLLGRAEARGTVRVLVELDLDQRFVPEGGLDAPQDREQQRLSIGAAQRTVVGAMTGFRAQARTQFRHVPGMVMEVDADALEQLASLPNVKSIEEDSLEAPLLDSSNLVIGSAYAWEAGYDGSGQVVAVLDTGIDKTHPFFSTDGEKVVSEACYSTTYAPYGASSVCPGGVSESVAVGSGVNCDSGVYGCDHGTHVAGIVAGNDGIGPGFGVAPGADLIAIQVFSRFDGDKCPDSTRDPCVLTFQSDQVKALERVYELRDVYGIAAVNMSLGGASYNDQDLCDAANTLRKAAIDTLHSVGIATVIASGNSGALDSVDSPGCISSAVSVGATTDDDRVASYSNVAPFLSLLAPGSSITSSVPGGGVAVMSGTSMATPHVAGAWAVLKQAHPTAGVDLVLDALRETATSVDDLRTSGWVTDMRRINLDQALGLQCSASTIRLGDGVFDGIGEVRSSNDIVTSGTGELVVESDAAVSFVAGHAIELREGFKVLAGAVLKARIAPVTCPAG